MKANILLTGATGFLGHRLASYLYNMPDVVLTASMRRNVVFQADKIVHVHGLDANTDWSFALSGQQVVIHTAARAHIKNDLMIDSLFEYRRVNVEGTLNLAQQASAAGVKRFIFLSSIGVNGNFNTKPFTEKDTPAPAELYAQTKWEAEQGLWDLQRETGMEMVIIRPPLVYGPNAPGNFRSLIRWVRKGIPLPLGAINNQRSFVALDNLVDLIITCIDHPSAANQVFLAGDGQDLSTTELLQEVALAMDKPLRLIPVSMSLLMFGSMLLGKRAVAQRLLGSLQVDISKSRDLLDWEPPITVQEGIRRCFEPQSN